MLDSNSGRPNQKTICTYRQFAILENVLNLLTERMSGIRDFVLEALDKSCTVGVQPLPVSLCQIKLSF